MGRGIHRGFITHEELNKSLGKRNLSNENLAQAFMHILDEKIVLVEKKSDYKILRKKVDLENICNGVKFLIESKSITGEIINIDGGQRLAWQTPDIINTKE